MIRAHRRVSENMTFRQELDVVNEVMELKGLQDQWVEQGPQLADVMGDRYGGQESNWEAVLAEISEVDEFFNTETVDPGAIQRTGSILTDRDLANRMTTSARSLTRVVEEAAAAFSVHLRATMQQEVFGGDMKLTTLRELAGETRRIASGIENVISAALGQSARKLESVEALPELLSKAPAFAPWKRSARPGNPLFRKISENVTPISTPTGLRSERTWIGPPSWWQPGRLLTSRPP